MSNKSLDTIWYTRCAGNGRGGVPTATGIASQLGWLKQEFAADGIKLRSLQDEDAAEYRFNHYDHKLPNLIREGGNLFSLPARAQGAKTRLIGLTWIDEGQAILVNPDSDIRSAADLKGKRLGLPAFNPVDIQENKRGRSIARFMALHGYKGALNSVGLSLDDIELVETHRNQPDSADGWARGDAWSGVDALKRGDIDGFYVKGGNAVDLAREYGLVVGVDIDALPEKRFRVNNGTPRPVTVHEDFIEHHFDHLVRFLYQVLRTAEWAKSNLDSVYEALHKETGASLQGLKGAYKNGFHLSLAPDLSPERVELFRQQKNFLLTYGVLDRDFDYDAWIDYRPLEAAKKLLAERGI
jgi:ABC-type nitrate/sulfonate/bicarbonate transport system substrate-binding protein